jgi:hypothetical protein
VTVANALTTKFLLKPLTSALLTDTTHPHLPNPHLFSFFTAAPQAQA